jgi:DoxX-like family
VRPLGVAAAIGLVLFFTGALATHVRTRVFRNIAVPGTFFALAAASAALALAAGLPGDEVVRRRKARKPRKPYAAGFTDVRSALSVDW